MLDALPLESWGMNIGRYRQPDAEGAAFLFEVEQNVLVILLSD